MKVALMRGRPYGLLLAAVIASGVAVTGFGIVEIGPSADLSAVANWSMRLLKLPRNARTISLRNTDCFRH